MYPFYWESVIKLEVPIGQVPSTSAPLIENDTFCLTPTLQIKIGNDGFIFVISRKDDKIYFVIAVNGY